MFRYIRLALIGLTALWATTGPTLSAEVTMRLRSSELTFNGNLISFNGKTYRVDTELFGTVNLDVDRFECVAGACEFSVQGSASTIGPDFGIYGSSTIGNKLMPALIGAYARSVGVSTNSRVSGDPDEAKIELIDGQGIKLASIDLKIHGSGIAFPALEGQVQIGMSSRPIKDEEAALLSSFREHVLALDGLLVIVSPQNPMSAISIDQLAQVFSGKISDWSQLGQAPGQINVYARDDGSGTFDTFKSLVLDPADRQIAPNARRFRSDAELSDAVAGDLGGIGFTGFAYKRNAKPLAISTACGITYPPSVFDVKTEQYPLSRRLFLYTTSEPNAEHAKGILNYALSDQAQEIVSGAGFVDRSVEYLAFKSQGDRIIEAIEASSDDFNPELMQRLVEDIGQLSRMSMTFRFRSASFRLDSRSQQNVQRLAALLSSDQLHDREIWLLGFSDAVGAFDRNRELSRIRAREVKQGLLSAGAGIDEARLKVRGYGELLPVGCNSDALGRAKNRRVEVWVGTSAAPSAKKKPSAAPSAKKKKDWIQPIF